MLRKTRWKVSEEYTHSDHQAIIIEIVTERGIASPALTGPKWKDKLLDVGMIEEAMKDYNVSDSAVEQMAQQLTELIESACDAAMPRRTPSSRGSPNYWWNDEIKTLRKEYLVHRRKVRARERANFHEHLSTFRTARKRCIGAKRKQNQVFKKSL